jgi:lipopolysaccharide export system protein LptA
LKLKLSHICFIFCLLFIIQTEAQERRKIQFEYAGFLDKDEDKYPGAFIFTRDDSQQVHIIHEGINLYCDKAVHYKDEDFVEAYGNVKVIQGDTINMVSKYVEYSGKTKIAFASGDVVLTEPTSTLSTDTLYFDRVKQQAFYKSYGKVVKDSSGTITSQRGHYYMDSKKYQFVNDVKLVNEEYTIDSNQLDFYSETGHAYLYGPTTITGETTNIYCERGFYDTERDEGHFMKNSKILYDNRIIEGDSLYFNRARNYASAINNITVTDTINNTVVKGHHAEVFRDKDSVFITKRALAISVQERDSIYIHGDTLMVTGKAENRITRAFHNVKIYKTDLSGKADSIHVNHKTGLTQMMTLDRFGSQDAFAKKRRPILWNVDNQMTGDSIHLISNVKTEKLDSLKVFYNAFLISKDTVQGADGFNQIKGRELIGLFKNNELYHVDVIKNAEKIYYSRNEEGELVGIDKSKSGKITVLISQNEIEEFRLINQADGTISPEDDFPANSKLFRGFHWRADERPNSVEDLFKDDPPLELPVIKGLDDYVPPKDFEDEELISRVEAAGKDNKDPKKQNKAARRLSNKKLNPNSKGQFLSSFKGEKKDKPVIKKKDN